MLSSLVNKTKSLVGITDICLDKKNDQLLRTFPNLDSLVIECNSLEMDSTISHESLQDAIFDCIRTIRDPEKPATLEDLQVVYEEGIKVSKIKGSSSYAVDIEFNPTVPHCTLATLIGLCMRIKVERTLVQTVKLNIRIKEGAHDTEDEINKQINDKERVAAAMENPNLKEMVEKCIKEED